MNCFVYYALLCVATLSTLTPASRATELVLFDQQPVRVGDRVSQKMFVELDLKTTVEQSGQIASQEITRLFRKQHRRIEVLEAVDGQTRRAHVSFPESRLQSPENKDPSQEMMQSIEGKSYFVVREGEQLKVTDLEGAIPPLDEFKLVMSSMRSLGVPSPLAKFLLGRTVRVGERLELPQALAREILGQDSQLGRIHAFELVLRELRAVDELRCAVFDATIRADGSGSSPVEMRVTGEVVLHPETCRTVHAKLSGPLALSATEHTPKGDFEYTAKGTLQVAVRSQYGHALK